MMVNRMLGQVRILNSDFWTPPPPLSQKSTPAYINSNPAVQFHDFGSVNAWDFRQKKFHKNLGIAANGSGWQIEPGHFWPGCDSFAGAVKGKRHKLKPPHKAGCFNEPELKWWRIRPVTKTLGCPHTLFSSLNWNRAVAIRPWRISKLPFNGKRVLSFL